MFITCNLLECLLTFNKYDVRLYTHVARHTPEYYSGDQITLLGLQVVCNMFRMNDETLFLFIIIATMVIITKVARALSSLNSHWQNIRSYYRGQKNL